ncbi:MAG: TlpA disulfide reductase family protein [bacterium]
MRRLTYLLIAFVCLCCILHCTHVVREKPPEKEVVQVETMAPDGEFDSVEGMPVSFRPPESKVLLALFWDTGGAGADDLAKDNVVLYRRFHDKGLNVVGVCADSSEDSVVSFASRWQLPWPHVMDEDTGKGKPTELLGVSQVPSSLLIDPTGKIVASNFPKEEAHARVAEILGVSLDEVPMPEPPTERAEKGPVGFGVAPPSPSVEMDPASLLGNPTERKEVESCKKNLRAISLALTDYRRDHNNELPNWLSDLFPQYLQDESVLLCPDNPVAQTRRMDMADPKLTCSYLFEFGGQYRQLKIRQLTQYGDKVAMVRCFNHSKRLSLSYGGEIYMTPRAGWEEFFPMGHTLEDNDAKVRKSLREIGSALAKYRKDKKEDPEKLEDLYPDYIKDKSLFACPVTGQPFQYEFSSDTVTPSGKSYREWKTEQLKEFGDYVPIVRARNVLPNGNVINLAYTGEIYKSPDVWEDFLKQTASAPAIRANVARAMAEQRALMAGLESFHLDTDAYPVPPEGSDTIDKAEIKVGKGDSARVMNLTSPISYLSRIPQDPFDPEGRAYRYNSDGKSWWIIASNGPDMKETFDVKKYNPDEGFGKEKLEEFLYDPSNGLESKGDIMRVGP